MPPLCFSCGAVISNNFSLGEVPSHRTNPGKTNWSYMESMLILAGVIAFQGVSPEAQSKLIQAYYSHSQCETFVNERLHHYDEMVSDSLKAKVGTIGYVTKTILEQRITVGWAFP
jgi:hypothetical protein